MSNAYVTTSEFVASQSGAVYIDLPSGEIQNYINRASSLIEQYCSRIFVHNASFVETLFSSGRGRAVIGNNGYYSLYPIHYYPINTVASITWTLITPALPPYTSVINAVSPVLTQDIYIETDQWNEGYRVRVFEDMGQYRDPGIVVKFIVTYDGGYTTYPDWLTEAAIRWTTGLLKRRGSQSFIMGGDGASVDWSSGSNSDIKAAKEALDPHRRIY